MHRDVRIAALRATAKLTLSISLVGCGSNSAPPTAPVEHSDAKPIATNITSPPPPTPTPPSCKTTLDETFVSKPASLPPTAKACCIETLENGGTHYEDCCAFRMADSDIRRACAPWGPPVPPPMRRIA